MRPFGWRFLLGTALSLLNCCLSSVGFTLQRKAQLLSEEEQQGGHDSKSGIPRHRLIWLAGVVIYVLAAVPDVLAYTLVPQVVCTTVACFRLVVVSFLAHIFLKERLQGREVAGMLACSVGTFLCLAFGPRPEEAAQVASAGEFYHPQVWTYLVIGIGTLVLLLALEHSDDLQGCQQWQDLHYVTLPLATGLAFALEKVFNTEIGFLRTPSGLSGLLSEPWWVAMAVSIALLGVMDFYLNLRGASKMPVQVFIPVSFALCTSLQFFQSIAIFGEFANMDAMHAVLSICGALISLAGAMTIKPPRLSLLGREQLLDEESEKSATTSRLGRTPEASEEEVE